MIIKPETFRLFVLCWIGFALLLFPLLLKVRAPYGRHRKTGWGPVMGNRAGWIVMELPSLVLFASLFLSGDLSGNNLRWIPFSLWVIHYFNRIFIYPLRTRTRGKKIPVLIVLFAMLFNLVNGFINGYWLGWIATDNTGSLLMALTIPIGLALFVAGFVINQAADNHLIRLRKGKAKGYYIPSHRLFRRISCPNFAGEILEWTGYAVLTWSLAGAAFAVWTAVNLIPRALHHHRWYQENLPGYPAESKAVIPWLL